MSLTLAMDVGTTSVRAALVSSSLEILAMEQQQIDLIRVDDDQVEQDGQQIIERLQAVVSKVLSASLKNQKLPANSVKIASLAIQRSTVIAWNGKTLQSLSPALSWQDTRAKAFVATLKAKEAQIKKRSGLVLSPHYGASKIRYLLRTLGEVSDEEHFCVGPLASFVIANIVEGQPYVCDESNAARTQLFDLQNRCWSQTLCESFELPLRSLPTLKPVLSNFGHLEGTQIALNCVCGDQNAAFQFLKSFSGKQNFNRNQTAYLNVGTGAFLLAETENSASNTALLKSVSRSQSDRIEFLLEGTVNGAGSALDWLWQKFIKSEGKKAKPSQEDFYKILAQALARNGTKTAPIFCNSIGDLGSPFWATNVTPGFFDMQGRLLDKNPDWITQFRAVLESIAFLVSYNLLEMSKQLGEIKQLVGSGGLFKSAGFAQLVANVMEMPLYLVENKEATVLGSVLLVSYDSEASEIGFDAYYPESDKELVSRRNALAALLQRVTLENEIRQ